MDNNQNQQPAKPVPEIPQGELKMPVESVPTQSATAPSPKHHVSPFLVILFVFSLALLGVAIVWGAQIIDILMPAAETPVLEPATDIKTEAQTPPTTEQEITNIEAEAAATEAELSASESELDAIEAEIEANLQ
ncbi:hypothetical protein A2392_02040 [Candidatus Kaiserbacteria bacterium RIFOXYB1_FULL_46_14]|uniref:Uncharacterized protein n=1 Tax=Candidatus Kaiserbacteria bacterium RIFOXYB1_FULL_46_14 TaxID=1798531 RepID=A0A1F6FI54_9BACT|nr:MAG: hypothetical protein A2392_02040 [Candidatus Kaiserbacteria bacterium RIFOXYB1_FULL_46_14]